MVLTWLLKFLSVPPSTFSHFLLLRLSFYSPPLTKDELGLYENSQGGATVHQVCSDLLVFLYQRSCTFQRQTVSDDGNSPG